MEPSPGSRRKDCEAAMGHVPAPNGSIQLHSNMCPYIGSALELSAVVNSYPGTKAIEVDIHRCM